MPERQPAGHQHIGRIQRTRGDGESYEQYLDPVRHVTLKRAGDVKGQACGEVGEQEHIPGHYQWIAPGVGLPLYDRQGGEALRRKDIPGQ